MRDTLRLRFLSLVAGAFGLGVGASACFSGAGTLGAYCDLSTDCGGEQSCENGICGRCGNGEFDRGELCFGAAQDFLVGGVAARMTPTHLNPEVDDLLDVVAAVNTDCGGAECWNLTLMINDGEGGFIVAQGFEDDAMGRVEGLEFDDFDGDGEVDALIALGDDSVLQVLIGVGEDEGDAGFFVELPHPPRTVVIADFNGDGTPDAAVGSDAADEQNVSVLLGDGTGSFDVVDSYDVGRATRLASPRDIDGDDEIDLIVTSAGTAELVIMYGDGEGGFEEADRRALPPGSWPIHSVAADFTLDGFLDVAVALPNAPNAPQPGTQIAVFAGAVGGLDAEPLYLDVGGDPVYIEAGDLNGDDLDDLLVANRAEDKISFFINRDGEIPDSQVLDASFGPNAIIREDFNQDGVPDLLVSYLSGVISLSPSRN